MFRALGLLLFIATAVIAEEEVKQILSRVLKEHGVSEILSVENKEDSDSRFKVKVKSTNSSTSELSLKLNGYPEVGYGVNVGHASSALNRRNACVKQVFPAMKELLKTANDDEEPIWIKTYGMENDVIVMDDLKEDTSYKKRLDEGLNLKECQVAMKNLAKFHALSAVLEKENKIPAILKESLFTKNKDKFDKYTKFLLEKFTDVVRKWGSEWQSKANKLQTLSATVPTTNENIFKEVKSSSDNFKVLNRKSFVRPKIWFKYKNGNGPEFAKVDWDMDYASVGSPVHDLQHFLSYSPADDIIVDKRNEIVDYYTTELEKYLKKYNYTGNGITKEQLKANQKTTSLIRLMYAIGELNALYAGIHVDQVFQLVWLGQMESYLNTTGMENPKFKATLQKLMNDPAAADIFK